MRKTMPLFISSALSVVIISILLYFEYKNDPGDSPWYSDIPVLLLFFVVLTTAFFSFYQLRNFLTTRIR